MDGVYPLPHCQRLWHTISRHATRRTIAPPLVFARAFVLLHNFGKNLASEVDHSFHLLAVEANLWAVVIHSQTMKMHSNNAVFASSDVNERRKCAAVMLKLAEQPWERAVESLRLLTRSDCSEVRESLVVEAILNAIRDRRIVRWMLQKLPAAFSIDFISGERLHAQLQFWLTTHLR